MFCFVLFVCLLLAFRSENIYSQNDSLIVLNAPWDVQHLKDGLVWKQVRFKNNELFGSNQNINVIEIANPSMKTRISVAVSDSLQTTSNLAQDHNAVVALNGSFFKMPGADPDDSTVAAASTINSPSDIHKNRSENFLKVNGKLFTENNYGKAAVRNFTQTGALVISSEGIFIMKADLSNPLWEHELRAPTIMTSGPLLLQSGMNETYPDNKFCENRHPRSAIGKRADGSMILVSVDGRAAEANGMTIGELQKLMRCLGCVDALNLDGGGSTSLVLRDELHHGVVNYPSDNKLFDHEGEREVANALIVNNTTLPTNQPTSSHVLLPNGWSLSPAGRSLPLGDLPLNMQFSPDKKLLAITNNGQGKQSIQLVDPISEKLLNTTPIDRSWYGLQFSADGKVLYAAGGNDNIILAYPVLNRTLGIPDTIRIGLRKEKISPTGIAVDNKTQRLYVVTKDNNSLYVVSLKSKKVLSRTDLGHEAFACILSPNKKELYISSWGGDQVLVYNVEKGSIVSSIPTESHPNEMIVTKSGKYLFVANSNSNSVSVINLQTRKVLESISTGLYATKLTGSTTNGLALSDDEKTLYIANADNNCLAVFDVSSIGSSKSMGFIPTGWYPTNVKCLGDKLFIANGKGFSSLANPNGPQPMKPDGSAYQKGSVSKRGLQYIGSLFIGTLSIIDQPDADQLSLYSKQVYANAPYNKQKEVQAMGLEGNPIPQNTKQKSPIKYVFYIIKENRTYDQVLGDVPEGNGDTSLCIFPEFVTPNQHALSKEFVLLDNFYVDAEVSADGHNWTTAAYANDFVEKTWPTKYGKRGGEYDYEGTREIAFPKDGFIWDYCQRAGVSYRSYAEFCTLGKPNMKVLEGHVATNFHEGLNIRDIVREQIWEADLDSLIAIDAVPQFSTIRFPNDHTQGQRLGSPTPRAMVADNDLAVGRFVEHLSHSPIWKESAVFIIEDDAQNGSDHVDAHRSTAYLASPYVKRGVVVSNMYSTSSMLRTMELILGLPPMSQYDAAAPSMYECFTNTPNYSPYIAKPANVDLDEVNVVNTPSAKLSAKWNLDVIDAAPDIDLNRVVWKSVRGENSEMPAPRRSGFVILEKKAAHND